MIKIFFLLILSLTSFSYERIVSTVPSLTETIIALDSGEKLVGVSQYCNFGSKFCSLPKVGTSIEPNYEKILSLKADLVILSSSSKKKSVNNLKKLNIRVEKFAHDSLNDVFETISKMGDMLEKRDVARKLITSINKDLSVKSEYLKNRRVLLVIGSTLRDGEIVNAYIAGSKNFYNDIFKKLDLLNAYESKHTAYPQLDRERIELIESDYIIQIFDKEDPSKSKEYKKAWDSIYKKRKNSPKYIALFGNHLFVPGPKIGKIASDVVSSIERSHARD
jgi:iron complex transport system substrate-binding protein